MEKKKKKNRTNQCVVASSLSLLSICFLFSLSLSFSSFPPFLSFFPFFLSYRAKYMKTGRGFLIIIGEGNSFIILQFILRFFLFESSSRNITENPRICLFLFSEISLKNMGNREICGRKRSSDYSPLTLNINPPTMDFPGPVFSYFQKFRSKTKRRRKQRKRDLWKKAIEQLFSD